MTGELLRRRIKDSLKKQGFRISDSRILPPVNPDKETIRRLHATAVSHQIHEARSSLSRREDHLLTFIANGEELNVQEFEPYLVEVRSRSDEELLFRYASLHWSIPISAGYGRRLRFLILDRSNGKLVGVIGLCDPVISLAGRDTWIGWSAEKRLQNLRHVMDAFVIGAVPPYSHLLCGKLIALLTVSNTVRDAFHRKYAGTKARISGREFDGRLALITTMSALGKSSLYNRLKFRDDLTFHSVGYSRGTGEFHFSNGLYASIVEYANRYCVPSYRQEQWGTGFRNRREVIRKCLKKIHLNVAWSYHGIEREVFVAPLARNCSDFLKGEHSRLRWINYETSLLIDRFRHRWMIPRAIRDQSFKTFRSETYRLWNPEVD